LPFYRKYELTPIALTPNEFGLYDMHANVFEWCSDEYAFDYYQRSPVDDPPGPSGMSTRVARGSGWRSPARKTWWTRFEGRDPEQRHFVVGFRVARTQSAIPVSEKPQVPPAGATGAAATTVKAHADQPPIASVAGPLSEELIKNPGCEETGADSKIPSWETVVGDWSRGSSDPDPFEGKAYFCPGRVPEAELRQDVDVSRFAEQINRKTQSSGFAAYVRSWDQNPPDTARIIIEFLGKGKSAQLSQIDSGPVASIGRWKLLESVKLAPAHTRWISNPFDQQSSGRRC
jgi:hypothetical protein